MSREEIERPDDLLDATFTDERGVTLTRLGVQRAGQRLAEVKARHTPEYFAALRACLDIPPCTA